MSFVVRWIPGAALAALLSASLTAGAVVVADPLPLVYGSGFAADGAAPGVFKTYGPALDGVTGSGTRGGVDYVNSASSLLVDGNPTVTVSGSGGAQAQAVLVFAFSVTGPDLPDTPESGPGIPIIVSGKLSARAADRPGALASAFISRADAGFNLIGHLEFACVSKGDKDCGAGSVTRNVTLQYSVVPNSIEYVYLFAGIDAPTPGEGEYFAMADPVVTVDPTFADAGLYRVRYSQGVHAVPEPGTWGLLAAGGGLMAAWFRRRRGRASA